MKEIEMLQAMKNSFPVRELQKMFGIKKTDSYWILKNRGIQTVTVNREMRILKESFWNWYSHQTKYRIIDGPGPGAALLETSYSVHDLMGLLDISEYIAYTLIGKGIFDTVTVDHQMRVTKESFERWYPTQDKYRLAEDRDADSKIIAVTYSMPEISRMLSLHRNTVYELLKKPVFKIVCVAGQKRVTIESFEKWYSSQKKHKKRMPEGSGVTENRGMSSGDVKLPSEIEEAAPQKETPEFTKDVYRLEDLMTALGIGRKAAYRLIQTGDIIAVKAVKSYLIPASEYKRYIEGRRKNGLDHSEK